MSAAVTFPSHPLVNFRDIRRPTSPTDNVREWNFCRKTWSLNAADNRPSKVWPDPDGRVNVARKVERADERTYFLWMADAGALSLMGRSQITCAVPVTEPDLVAGFVAYEPRVLHMIYVSGTFRRMGLARALLGLLPAGLRTYSQWSPLAEKLLPRAKGWQWSPQEGNPCPHPDCAVCRAIRASKGAK